MTEKLIFIKNMVCNRCITAVAGVFEKEKIAVEKIILGEVQLKSALKEEEKKRIEEALQKIGFELIDNRSVVLVEKIKSIVIKKARNEQEQGFEKWKLSSWLTQALNHEYTYLSSLFSSIEGRTIENYFIVQRIEKAKELLVYGEHSLSEIAHQLDYSSVAHLSAQFKKVTGLTPSYFKEVGNRKRKGLDKI